MASEPVVVCGSKSIRWSPFFWGLMEALELQRDGETDSSLNAFKSLVSVTSLWLDLYRKEEFSQPVVRKWADNISHPLLSDIATRFLDFLENYSQYVIYLHSSIAIATVSSQMLRGLRPLNNIWILPPLLIIGVTMFFRPTPRSNAWMESFRGMLIDVLNMTRHRQASEHQDKVYALYGVLAALGLDLHLPKEKASFEEVYLDFTKQIINWQDL